MWPSHRRLTFRRVRILQLDHQLLLQQPRMVDLVARSNSAVLQLLEDFHSHSATKIFRREMYYALRAAIRIKLNKPQLSLAEAIREVQMKIRHAGRKLSRRTVGSTLLVKALEFDRAVILGSPNMSRKDWYVALTRATKGMTIISSNERIIFDG